MIDFMIIIQFVGLLWLLVEYVSDNKFSCHFLLFVYILKFVSFLLENEYGRFRILRHTASLVIYTRIIQIFSTSEVRKEFRVP